MLTLKDALPEDEAFFYHLYVLTRKGEFAILGLSEQQMDGLLRMQYEAQKVSYRQQFPLASYQIVLNNDIPIGRMITEIQDSSIRLIDISLLPKYRGRGFGTELLRELQGLAENQGFSVTLQVFQGNPARRLYERCGFYVVEEVVPYLAMKWER